MALLQTVNPNLNSELRLAIFQRSKPFLENRCLLNFYHVSTIINTSTYVNCSSRIVRGRYELAFNARVKWLRRKERIRSQVQNDRHGKGQAGSQSRLTITDLQLNTVDDKHVFYDTTQMISIVLLCNH